MDRQKKNKINDYYHKTTTKIVKKYDIIILEDLNIKGMFQNPRYSPKLQKIAWKKFVEMIKYKAEIYGKTKSADGTHQVKHVATVDTTTKT